MPQFNLSEEFKSGSSWSLVLLIYLLGIVVLVIVGVLPSVRESLRTTSLNLCGVDNWMKKNTSYCVRLLLRGPNYTRKINHSNEFFDTSYSGEADFNVIFTGWAATHVLLYWILGFCAPHLWFPLFLVGVLWEVCEYIFKCHCIADIIWNSVGIAGGILTRKIYDDITTK